MSAPAVEASGWGWRYAGRRAWAVRGLDLRIEAGERVLLVGVSGAGKSTLLTALAGLLDPAAGDAEGDLRVHAAPPRLARDRVGYLFQDPEAQIVMARARDEVAFGLENRCLPRERIWPRVDASLAEVRFPYAGEHQTYALSGGEQQRLALAATLAAEPSLLLLDEPTANLDADAAAAYRAVLGEQVARTGATVLLVEHRVDRALELVERVVVVEPGGGLVADGSPGEVFARHGDELADRGVWVADRPPTAPRRVQDRTPGPPLLGAVDVTFRYPRTTLPAVDGASATVRAGEALGIVGPNGSGKSTLLLLLAGLLRPARGTVRATPALDAGPGGDELWRWSARRLAARIGTVFQEPEHQFLTGRVIDELLLGPRRVGLSEPDARRRATELLDRLHLAPLAEANPYTLSGGEKRRLSVATALAAAPSVLLLDEPTFGLDRRTYIDILELLAGLVDTGRGVGFVTHDAHFADLLADRTLSLTTQRTASAPAA